MVLKKGAKAAVETALEDLMVAGRGRPAKFTVDVTYDYQDANGNCFSKSAGWFLKSFSSAVRTLPPLMAGHGI